MELLRKRFGIDRNSRMSFVTTKDGVLVWDLEMEIEYTIKGLNSAPVATPRAVPEAVKVIFELSDDELKARRFGYARSYWDDEQTSVVSELAYRSIKAN